MFTFGFFAKCFFSGLLIACLLGGCVEQFQFEETLIGKIAYWILNILCPVACGCVFISIFGMIWTL